MIYGRDYGDNPPCGCGNRKPKLSGCVDCGGDYCEQCAEVVDGDLVCAKCIEKRKEAMAEVAEVD